MNMGNNLLAYSGIATKVKAMSSHLITEQEYRKLASFSNVQDVAQYLKAHPTYRNEFAESDSTMLHRGEMEQILRYSIYDDYLKLYRFASQKQRVFFHLYFSRYEIQAIKACFRQLFITQANALKLERLYPFFEKHSAISLPKAVACTTVGELAEILKGSNYEKIFYMIDSSSSHTLFDYEIALDLLHFISVWNQIGKMKDETERNVLTETYGSLIDLLNIQWIYRSKRYYKVSAADIYALTIPINYKLQKHTFSAMVEAETADEMLAILQTTYYAKYFKKTGSLSLERMYHHIQTELYEQSVRKYPYSAICIFSYLYKKEVEVNRLISLLEGIRYRLPAEKILKIIL